MDPIHDLDTASLFNKIRDTSEKPHSARQDLRETFEVLKTRLNSLLEMAGVDTDRAAETRRILHDLEVRDMRQETWHENLDRLEENFTTLSKAP